jgi:hypothetical protein
LARPQFDQKREAEASFRAGSDNRHRQRPENGFWERPGGGSAPANQPSRSALSSTKAASLRLGEISFGGLRSG